MSGADLIALLPILVLAAAIVVTMLVIAFFRNHVLAASLTLVSLGLAFAALFVAAPWAPRQVTPLLAVDSYSLFFAGLIMAASFAVALLSYGYLERMALQREEFYLLLLLATLGSIVLASATHFASFFLGLEILSVALYGMIAYPRWRQISIEAGLKYLVLAGASSAFLLFGMALVYGELGTMEFGRLASAAAAGGSVGQPAIVLTGLSMMLVGFGFKLAVAPFHLWTPDVYEGAPAPATAFVATVSKGATFALLLRFFTQVDIRHQPSLFLTVAVISVASMLGGNLLALRQNNVKRILAYSSISHLGYLLVALLASGPLGPAAVAFYLVAYFVTTLGTFGVVTVLSGPDRDADSLEDYRGLFWRRPWIAGVFTAMMLSLAGIPLTAGFVGKFYLVSAGVGSALWVLVVILVVGSGIGLYYYLRVVSVMFVRQAEGEVALVTYPSAAGSLVLGVLSVLLLWFGVYPSPLIDLIQATVGRLG